MVVAQMMAAIYGSVQNDLLHYFDKKVLKFNGTKKAYSTLVE